MIRVVNRQFRSSSYDNFNDIIKKAFTHAIHGIT